MIEMWEAEILSIYWGVAYICPIHKKGDKQVCSNYRGIALLDTTYKVLSYCILDRIKPLAEKVVGDYQCGFRQNRSTTDQIFIIRQLFQKSWEYNNIRQTKVKVKVRNATSRMVEVRTGLRQGDALSPVLFDLVLEKVIREINIGRDEGVRMDRTCFSLLAYADNIVLLGEDEQKVVDLCGRLIESAKKVGLHLNIEKTQYMKVSSELDNLRKTETITVGQYEFKKVEDFKYLGTIVAQKNEFQIEIQQRIKMGNKCFYALGKLLSSKVLSKEFKT
ncbi:ribosome biogenesis protein TSR3 isoform X1 [Aphis craccivora]|uniref:Ribosome biogenesis protein TSR3 isoform X1 n=1 Tax=Aphis craccivora TaxID=307492 RepID=A0A6G0YXQ8_APHCR|nr:ribosome biogenesis protein TSR3 isoform X1 [Aphis craccivora]